MYGYRKRRSYYKKRSYRRRGYGAKKMVKVARKVTKSVIKNMSERKFVQTNIAITVADTGGVVDISAISRGTSDDSERVGDRVQWTSLQVRGVIGPAADAYNTVRVIFFVWHPQTSWHTPTAGDILKGGGTSVPNAANLPYVVDDRDQFTVIYDTRRLVQTGQGVLVSKLDFWKKVNGKAQYLTTSSTNRTNSVWMFACSDSSVSTHPGLTLSCFLRYLDI